VSVIALRSALGCAERELGIDHLLFGRELRTDAGRVFLERYGALIGLSASGRLAMKRLSEDHLKRVEWGESRFPVRLYPLVRAESAGGDRPIVIDPRVAFGRPVVVRKGTSASAFVERLDVGEAIDAVAADYGLEPSEIEQAILYERAA
jgi:uncharacterized protein (DUF433 family)